MRAVLGFTLLAALAIAGAWWLAAIPGGVSVTVLGTTIETSAPVALTLLALLFLAMYIVIRLLAGIIRLPGIAGRWRSSKNRRRGDSAVTRTLVALAANDTDAARREAGASRRLLGETPLTLLLAAQAERQAGREDAAQAIFKQLTEIPNARLLGLRGQLRMATAREDWIAASELAKQAEAAYPGAAWLTDERRRMALLTGQYREALRLMGPPRRRATSDAAVRAALGVAAADEETDQAASLRLAKTAFEAQSALGPAAIAYATRLRAAGKDRSAADVLRRCWTLQPHPDVAEAFLAPITDRLARHRAAAGLINANPAHPDSALLLARTALDAGLASDARRHATTARQAGLDDRRLWVLLADIAELDGDRSGAQEALRQIPGARAEPAWRCDSCGAAQRAWRPVCDSCGTPGAIVWGARDDATPTVMRALPSPATIEGIA
jgi:HemY protein